MSVYFLIWQKSLREKKQAHFQTFYQDVGGICNQNGQEKINLNKFICIC